MIICKNFAKLKLIRTENIGFWRFYKSVVSIAIIIQKAVFKIVRFRTLEITVVIR